MYESTSIYVPCQLGSLGFGKVGVFFKFLIKKWSKVGASNFPPTGFNQHILVGLVGNVCDFP